MVTTCAIYAARTDEERVHGSFRSGCEDQPVTGAVGWVGRVDLADLVWIAVVEGAFLRYVAAELAVINEVSRPAEMEQDRFAWNRGRSDALEYGLGHWYVEGCCTVDDDAVTSRELFKLAVLLKGAVDDRDVAQCRERSVESCGAKVGCDWDVGVRFAEDGQEGSFIMVNSLIVQRHCYGSYRRLVPMHQGTVRRPFESNCKMLG